MLPAETEPAHRVLPVSAHAVTAYVLTPSMYRTINNTEMRRFTKDSLNLMRKEPAVAQSIGLGLKTSLGGECGG